MRATRRVGLVVTLLGAAGLVFARAASAQSLTAGSLQGVVRDPTGSPLADVAVTLESPTGGTVRSLKTDRGGSFRVGLLASGDYRLLAELAGYQPVRRSGVVVSAGRTTMVEIVVERRPPPILAVTEVDAPGSLQASAGGRVLGSARVRGFPYRQEGSDLFRGITELIWPSDGREGVAVAADGVNASHGRLVVDGVPDLLLRHPGLPADPVPLAQFNRRGLDQAQILSAPFDTEWRGSAGPIVALQTRRGEGRLMFSPYATFSSGTIARRPTENPADSAATSFQAGAVLSGAVIPDTAQFLVYFDYQSLERATPFPFENDAATYRGQSVGLREQLAAIAADSFGTTLAPYLNPVVRSWRIISGGGRFDWQLSPVQALTARFNLASTKERAPQLGEMLGNGAGSSLSATDLSGAIAFTRTGDRFANELRTGFAWAKRTFAAPGLPETRVVGDAAEFGGSALLPGGFDAKLLDVADALQYTVGQHQLKGGVSLTFHNYIQEYGFLSSGAYLFGDLDHFGAGTGTFVQTVGAAGGARYNSTELGTFLQDSWNVTPEIKLLVGFRYEADFLPAGKIALSQEWLEVTGVSNTTLKSDKGRIQPRIGFVWDVRNRGDWVIRGVSGLYRPRIAPEVVAEAITYNGGVRVRRGSGTFADWPDLPDQTQAPAVGRQLTVLNPTFRAPRAFKSELGLTKRLPARLSLSVSGGYYHTDFLPYRVDLNRTVGALGTSVEGRPIYGVLEQQGALVGPTIGSNRRFSAFDLVSGISPTGFSDYYGLTGTLERQSRSGLSLALSYTYSKTTDNLIGQRFADPADHLNPFPDGIDGADWSRGRSDFDVPHRVAATAEYRIGASMPVTIGARFRARSGLPYTPGFRSGVDLNGDGGGNNDPIALATTSVSAALAGAGCDVTAIGAFVGRNSCREKMDRALDLHLSVGLPMGRERVVLSLEAFNVAASPQGIVDRAVVLIDRAGQLGADGSGNVVVPFVANPGFGALLSRRGAPRIVRIGARVDY